jgi:hypothetical protein
MVAVECSRTIARRRGRGQAKAQGEARNLETITLPWLKFKVLTPPPIELRTGTSSGFRRNARGCTALRSSTSACRNSGTAS